MTEKYPVFTIIFTYFSIEYRLFQAFRAKNNFHHTIFIDLSQLSPACSGWEKTFNFVLFNILNQKFLLALSSFCVLSMFPVKLPTKFFVIFSVSRETKTL